MGHTRSYPRLNWQGSGPGRRRGRHRAACAAVAAFWRVL